VYAELPEPVAVSRRRPNGTHEPVLIHRIDQAGCA
jgi:hypothetical protein